MTTQKNRTGLFILIFICGLIVGGIGAVLFMNHFSDKKSDGSLETETETIEETVIDESAEVDIDDPIPTDETELVVLKVNDAGITMKEVNIYMYQLRDFYTAQYGEAPWDEVVSEAGITVREYAKDELKKGLIRTEILISKADEYEVSLSDHEKQICADEAMSYIKSIGPVICQDFGLTEEADRLVKEKTYLSTKVYNAALEKLAETMEGSTDAELAEAFEQLYAQWLEEYTITEDPTWENIVLGSVG